VTVEPERLVAACLHLRDEDGFNMLVDIAATDYLGWAEKGVAGYIGTRSGRDINHPGSQGLAAMPEPKQKRFSLSYHLLRLRPGSGEAPRLRLKVWVDDGEPVPSVISVWPTADWFEREAWDMMGIPVEGHPNLKRLLMDDDWEGHPLRKDYPIGGEPVRFSGEE
jgi:NADH-quinone oxidoreductase subunit C